MMCVYKILGNGAYFYNQALNQRMPQFSLVNTFLTLDLITHKFTPFCSMLVPASMSSTVIEYSIYGGFCGVYPTQAHGS